jgi:hypothetical protein
MTGPTQRPEPRIVSATSRPPLRLRGWPLWGWSALVLAAVATLIIEGYALFWIALGVSVDRPTPEDAAAARDASRGLLLTVLAPWALASSVLRPHLRVVVTALLCAAPAIWCWREVSQVT